MTHSPLSAPGVLSLLGHPLPPGPAETNKLSCVGRVAFLPFGGGRLEARPQPSRCLILSPGDTAVLVALYARRSFRGGLLNFPA